MTPLKQTLINLARRWGNMFQQHLSDHVVSSLTNLSEFIREADEGLMRPLVEGDYDGLVLLMGYLMNVKDRQATTDEMFAPLHKTIELLKLYELELPEEVNVYLQVIYPHLNTTMTRFKKAK